MSSRIELSIVMPCLNEAETLAICIQKAHEGVKNAGVDDYEIVIADNGSTDGSLEIAKDEGAIVVKVPQRGYGAALITGIQRASGKYIIMGDSDDSYDFSNLAPFVNELRNRRQLVMGTRIKGDIKPEAMPALHRYLGTPVLTFLGNLFFGSRLSDFNCGMRGFDRKAILNLSLISPGMEFASEMVIRAAMAGLDVVEIPIEYFPDGRTRPPYLQTWRDGWRHLNFMLVFSPRWLFLYPGILMTIVGLIGGLLLLPRPFVVGAITLDVHSLLFFSTILVAGTQLISFASVARIFASISGYLPKNEKLEAIVSKMSRG
jgi:glycosyltransferase involved in cell wall biosynthesis